MLILSSKKEESILKNNLFLQGFGAIEPTAAIMMEMLLKWLVSQEKQFIIIVKIQANVFSN